jgi:hypothetical protein
MKRLIIGFAMLVLALPAAAVAANENSASGGPGTAPPAQEQAGGAANQASNAALLEQGHGNVDNTGQNCATAAGAPPVCFSSTGWIAGRPIDNGGYIARLTVDWSRQVVTSDRGTCAPAGGSVDLQRKNGDTLNLDTSGAMCQTSTGVYQYTGTYSIDNGENAYAQVGKGTGTVSATINPGGMTLQAMGDFALTDRQPI